MIIKNFNGWRSKRSVDLNFSKILHWYGEGGGGDKRELLIAAAANPRETKKNFTKICVLNSGMVSFQKF